MISWLGPWFYLLSFLTLYFLRLDQKLFLQFRGIVDFRKVLDRLFLTWNLKSAWYLYDVFSLNLIANILSHLLLIWFIRVWWNDRGVFFKLYWTGSLCPRTWSRKRSNYCVVVNLINFKIVILNSDWKLSSLYLLLLILNSLLTYWCLDKLWAWYTIAPLVDWNLLILIFANKILLLPLTPLHSNYMTWTIIIIKILWLCRLLNRCANSSLNWMAT